jgi:WD40 repeat protein
MGVVYRAVHLGLKRPVALKVLRHADRSADVLRLGREAELAARLQHPNIVQVYEVGTFRGPDSVVECPYIAFEQVAGSGLDSLLRKSLLPPATAAALLEILARTMQAVHEQGVVHRDLKPANVLLASGACQRPEGTPQTPGGLHPPLAGVPKITDFGLACLYEEYDGGLTRTGQLLGTPGYMAPEQVDGRRQRVGPAADIHALGIILYECLTGRSPYKGASLHETLTLICGQEAVHIRQLRPDVPRDLETICLKCLHKEPARRYASAAALADDLARFCQGRPICARPVSRLERCWRFCRRQPVMASLVAACVLLGVALIAGGGWYASRLARANAETATAREVAATQEYYALLQGVRERASRREPGWTQAGLADIARAAGLATRAVDRGELRGEATRCLAGIDLRPPRIIPLGFTASRIAYHPRGQLLAVAEAKGWFYCTVDLIDLAQKQVVLKLALLSRPCKDRGISVQDGVRALAFSPDGRWLVAGTRTGWLHRWDLREKVPPKESWSAHTSPVADLLFSASGDAVFSLGEDHTLKRWSIRECWKSTHAVAYSGRIARGALPDSLLVSDGKQLHHLRQADLTAMRPPLAVSGRLIRQCGGGPIAIAEGASLVLVDCQSGHVTQTLRNPGREEAHLGEIDFLASSDEGTVLASASQQNRRVRLWEVAGGRILADLPVGEAIAHVAFAPQATHHTRELAILAGKSVQLHEVGGFGVQTFAALQSWPVLACSWVGTEGLVCLAGDRRCRRGKLTLWSNRSASAPTWQRDAQLPIARLPVRLDAGSDGTTAWTEGNGLAMMQAHLPGELKKLSPGEMQSLAFAPNGRLWLAAGCSIESRDTARGVSRLGAGPSWNNNLGDMLSGLGTLYAVAAGRQHVLVGGRDGALRLLDARTGELRQNWRMCTSPVGCVALSPDERLALVGTWKGGVKLVHLPQGKQVEVLGHHRDRVNAVAFLGNQLIVSGSADRTIKIWRLGETPTEWLTIQAARVVGGLWASPDAQRLAVLLAGDRAVRIWNLELLRQRLEEIGLE